MAPVREILSDIRRWREGGERFALATVVATRRSAPRPVGSKVGVSERGELVGSVSGGCVEADVYGNACEVLAGGDARLLTYGIADDEAFEVGLPCGGEIDVRVETHDDALVDRLLEAYETDEHAVLFSVLDGDAQGRELLVLESGERLGDGPEDLAALAGELIRGGRSRLLELEGRTVFADVLGPPPRLLVFGAVDTAEALCRAARDVGWRTTVADARGKFATPERIPSADELVVAWPQEAIARVRPDHATAVVVLTHDEKFDVPALIAALETPAVYIGAMGSKVTTADREERLRAEGVDDAGLGRIHAPIGLAIGARSPEEVAVAIGAEIVEATGLARRRAADESSVSLLAT
jgi:xanthine dehydrogenase accessory factor